MKNIKRAVAWVLSLIMIGTMLAGCGKAEIIDYADAAAFESALNSGIDVRNKIVQFTASEIHPDSATGYNIWAGEHLNFISSKDPDVKAGDTVVVKVIEAVDFMGSWMIGYEKVKKAEVGATTISSGSYLNGFNGPDSSESAISVDNGNSGADSSDNSNSFAVNNSSDVRPLEIVDHGWYINDPSDSTAYVDFCALIKNPNDSLVAQFPKIIVTVINGDGSIIATDEQVGGVIQPGDTITLCGMMSMSIVDITGDAQIEFSVECDEFSNDSFMYSAARTTDFEITNVSEKNGSDNNFITGQITNNYSEAVDQLNVAIVLRKDGKIVFMENTFIDGISAGQTKAFEFQRYHAWPEHDTIDVSAMVW